MANLCFTASTKKLITICLNISFTLLLFFYITNYIHTPKVTTTHNFSIGLELATTSDVGCNGLEDKSIDYKTKCVYVKSHVGCKPKGYLNYLSLFYCNCGKFPLLGHFVVLLWLLVLFYLLGSTAATYFCPSLESLSKTLKLPPTIAGVTLLSLGNGASDVFACIVSFSRSSDGRVGLNSVLGGGFVVSTIVVGVISLLVSDKNISVDKVSFLRDVLFFVASLFSLLFIFLIGKITLFGAFSFLSIYFLYVLVVCVMQCFHHKKKRRECPILVIGSTQLEDSFMEMGIPLLGYVDEKNPIPMETKGIANNQNHLQFPILSNLGSQNSCFHNLGRLIFVLELPLYLPRRLTIPVISEEKWSKPYAITSVTLAPILIATLLLKPHQDKKLSSIESSSTITMVAYMTSGLIGIILGNIANVSTNKLSPPKKCLFPWLFGGFLMSVTWTYITAQELVSLLVSLGYIFGISPSILGLTVLAWGSSLGDLISNVTMAIKGGRDGAQIAISGCYAGPMFNTLIGLGTSFIISTWSRYPSPYFIPQDPYIIEALGFMIGGLLWAIVILPAKNMRLHRFLGVGLLAIYLCFLSLRLSRTLGLLNQGQ